MKPTPILTSVDIIVIAEMQLTRDFYVLMIKRKNDPYKNQWAFPGGFVDENELFIDAAIRELKEETGLRLNSFSLRACGYEDSLFRDPRGRVVTQIFETIFKNVKVLPHVEASDDAKEIEWIKYENLIKMDLAFDHLRILTNDLTGR